MSKLKGYLAVAGCSFAIIFMILATQVEGQQSRRLSIQRLSEPVAVENITQEFVAPAVFQAAGPNIASIQSSVAEFRTALGNPVNGNTTAELENGRREINWDGAPPNDVTT